jgi:uncharacterized protein (TIGR02996 family)
MNHERAFLEAIRAEPDEDVHRLAYADWLSEQDELARRDRGDFIRAQCAIARLDGADPAVADLTERAGKLLERYRADWTDGAFAAWLKHPKKQCRNPKGHAFCQGMARGVAARLEMETLPPDDSGMNRLQKVIAAAGRVMERHDYNDATCTQGLFDDCTFRRGFIDRAVVQNYMMVLFAEAVVDLTLATDLRIDEEWALDIGDGPLDGLLRVLDRCRLRSLDLACPPAGTRPIQELAASPALARLRELDLFLPEGLTRGDKAAALLAASPHLSNLRRLALSAFTLGDEGLGALLDSPHLAGLAELALDVETRRFSSELWQRYQARFGKE